MLSENNPVYLSSTVMRVIDEFLATLRTDNEIESEAVDRFEALLQNAAAPKADDIEKAIFGTMKESQE